MESLNIIVKDISQSLDEESIGQTAIPINQIQDQELHHDWINLYDSKGGLLPGKILIETQWLFSSVFFIFFKFFIYGNLNLI